MHTAALREHGAMADAGAESHTVRGIDGPMGGARAAAPARRPGWGDSDAMDDGTLTFAALLKRHRRAAGLSQEALAARAGYSAVYVGMVERGQRRPPAATVELLAHALTLSPAERATFERAAARAPALAAPDDGLLTPFPALAPLPVVPTPLLGREAAVAEATALLEREGVRLLTLTGPGGVGKTRLAIRLAEVVADRHPGGVHFVDLSALADPALFLSTLARALDVRGAPRDALIAALRGRRVLLVLDNMEQVAAAGPALADVFAHCPEPTALVTSRVPLRVRGEHIFPVPPLALPDAAAAAGDIDALAGVAAVRLFMQRARSMRPDVALTPATAPDVVALCQALDGLPLALERAAARCRLLSPRELRARLAGGLGTLGDGPRDAPARQRTLEATVAWSEGLLDARERRLFRWFSVAAGGCALAAVEALGVAAGIPAGEVLDAASALVDHGLVRRDEGPDGDTRLLLLETPRVYGVRQLARGGEEGAARRVHAAHHIALAAAAEPGLKGREQGMWLARLRAEDANARAILAWALGDGDPGVGLRLAAFLWRSWWMQGHVYEGLRTLEALIDRTAAGAGGVTDLVRAKAIHGAGVLAYWCGDFPRAVARSEQGLALFRQLGEEGWSASALLPLADVARHRGDDARARGLLTESLALARRAGDAQGVAFALLLLGVLWSEQGLCWLVKVSVRRKTFFVARIP